MNFTANAESVTTGLLVAFALFVVFIRWKNWLDSNIPIFFYVVMIGYMKSISGGVPFWLLSVGCSLTVLLRFEFMNERFTTVVKILEIAVLGVIIYLAAAMVLA